MNFLRAYQAEIGPMKGRFKAWVNQLLSGDPYLLNTPATCSSISAVELRLPLLLDLAPAAAAPAAGARGRGGGRGRPRPSAGA